MRRRGLCQYHSIPAKRRTARNGEPQAWLADAVANRDRSTGCWTDWPFGIARDRAGLPRPAISEGMAVGAVLALDGRPRPDGLEACHSLDCTTAMCLNPDHLRWDTHAQNQRDMRRRGSWRNQHADGPWYS